MPYETWPAIINPPQDGELVDHSTTARAHEALSDRTEYLKQRLVDYSSTNGRILIPSVQLASDVNIGDVVYYDASNEVYGRALAEGVVDTSTGLLSATPRAFAIGICVSKLENYGDVLVSGSANLENDFLINPANLFDNASSYSPNGTRGYLSTLSPGKLTSKPVSPLIQLGLFSSSQSFVIPLQKDVFESHLHYRFPIPVKPAASQNTDQTGIKLIDDVAYIDYYDGPNSYPQLLLSIRKNDSQTDISSYNPARIIIGNSLLDVPYQAEGGTTRNSKLSIRIITGDINIEADSEGIVGNIDHELDWPEYGDYIDIPDAGLSVSFSRRDADYTNSLWEDMDDELFDGDDKFKIYLPDDFVGWTNSNLKDPTVPPGSLYRLVHENIQSLNAVWPPTPLESTIIEMNGMNRARDIEFSPNMFGVFWKAVTPPWVWNGTLSLYDQFLIINGGNPSGSSDFTIVNENVQAFLYFSKTSLENSRSVVMSLGSNSPMISVTDCFSGLSSSVGHLKLGLNLALNEENTIGSNYYGLSRIDPTTNKFKKTTVVSELVAGLGVTITKNLSSTPGSSVNCGPLTIGMRSMKMEGIIDVVSLINAKEDLVEGIVPVIWFLQPSTGSYKMVSRVKIPNEDVTTGTISVNLYPSALGSATQVGAANAVFNVSHYRVRAGSTIYPPPQVGSTAEVVFSFAGTTGYSVLAEQQISVSGSIATGDQIYTVWERVATGQGSTSDTYAANVGFSQVRWKIEVTP